MVLIYRGLGILVPIVLFITGWIVSFWYEDTRIGNPNFMGWTLFYTAIVCLLMGLATIGAAKEETDDNGQRVARKRPHFFFIPIIFWAPIFGGVSAYLLLNSGKTSDPVEEQQVAMPTVPLIHFYNPTADTLEYLIYSPGGLSSQEKVAPGKVATLKIREKSYLLGALDAKGEATMTLPYYEDYDAKLYEKVKEDDKTIEQRLIRPLSENPNDYEDNWMLMDGSYDLLLVDVTELYNGTLQKDKIAGIDWVKKIKSRHVGSELIEFSIAPATPDGSVYVNNPNTYLPVSNPKGRSVYMLVTIGSAEEPGNALIRKAIEHVGM